MSHTIDYSGMGEVEGDKKALEDAKWYLGKSLFEKTENLLKANIAAGDVKTVEQVEFALSWVGIHGRPARAWARKLGIAADMAQDANAGGAQ